MSLHYIVSQEGAHWQASFAGAVMGPFLTVDEAVAAAVEDAGKRETDEPIEVIVQEEDRRTRTVWRSKDGER